MPSFALHFAPQAIYAFVTLKAGHEHSEELRRELVATVRKIIGPFAAPDVIHWVSVCAWAVPGRRAVPCARAVRDRSWRTVDRNCPPSKVHATMAVPEPAP